LKETSTIGIIGPDRRLRAAIFSRGASSSQQFISWQTQSNRQYCDRRGYAIVCEFTNFSKGSLADDQLLQAVDNGNIEVVIVTTLDRLNLQDGQLPEMCHYLRRRGVRIECSQPSLLIPSAFGG
jgi:DNA invertase Pin-like site-specific DNA recombinase